MRNRFISYSLFLLPVLAAGTIMPPSVASAQTNAPAQIEAGAIVFHNQTDRSLRVESVSIVDRAGNQREMSLRWDIEPGRKTYLAADSAKIVARRFDFKIVTDEGTSTWHVSADALDSDGDFVVVFDQQLLKSHLARLGAAAVADANAGPDEEAVKRGVAKIVIALAANAIAHEKPDDLAGAIVVELARSARDGAVESALSDLFPQLSSSDAAGIRRLVCLAADGRLDTQNLSREEARERMVARLRQIDDGMASVVEIADIITRIQQTAESVQQ